METEKNHSSTDHRIVYKSVNGLKLICGGINSFMQYLTESFDHLFVPKAENLRFDDQEGHGAWKSHMDVPYLHLSLPLSILPVLLSSLCTFLVFTLITCLLYRRHRRSAKEGPLAKSDSDVKISKAGVVHLDRLQPVSFDDVNAHGDGETKYSLSGSTLTSSIAAHSRCAAADVAAVTTAEAKSGAKISINNNKCELAANSSPLIYKYRARGKKTPPIRVFITASPKDKRRHWKSHKSWNRVKTTFSIKKHFTGKSAKREICYDKKYKRIVVPSHSPLPCQTHCPFPSLLTPGTLHPKSVTPGQALIKALQITCGSSALDNVEDAEDAVRPAYFQRGDVRGRGKAASQPDYPLDNRNRVTHDPDGRIKVKRIRNATEAKKKATNLREFKKTCPNGDFESRSEDAKRAALLTRQGTFLVNAHEDQPRICLLRERFLELESVKSVEENECSDAETVSHELFTKSFSLKKTETPDLKSLLGKGAFMCYSKGTMQNTKVFAGDGERVSRTTKRAQKCSVKRNAPKSSDTQKCNTAFSAPESDATFNAAKSDVVFNAPKSNAVCNVPTTIESSRAPKLSTALTESSNLAASETDSVFVLPKNSCYAPSRNFAGSEHMAYRGHEHLMGNVGRHNTKFLSERDHTSSNDVSSTNDLDMDLTRGPVKVTLEDRDGGITSNRELAKRNKFTLNRSRVTENDKEDASDSHGHSHYQITRFEPKQVDRQKINLPFSQQERFKTAPGQQLGQGMRVTAIQKPLVKERCQKISRDSCESFAGGGCQHRPQQKSGRSYFEIAAGFSKCNGMKEDYYKDGSEQIRVVNRRAPSQMRPVQYFKKMNSSEGLQHMHHLPFEQEPNKEPRTAETTKITRERQKTQSKASYGYQVSQNEGCKDENARCQNWADARYFSRELRNAAPVAHSANKVSPISEAFDKTWFADQNETQHDSRICDMKRLLTNVSSRNDYSDSSRDAYHTEFSGQFQEVSDPPSSSMESSGHPKTAQDSTLRRCIPNFSLRSTQAQVDEIEVTSLQHVTDQSKSTQPDDTGNSVSFDSSLSKPNREDRQRRYLGVMHRGNDRSCVKKRNCPNHVVKKSKSLISIGHMLTQMVSSQKKETAWKAEDREKTLRPYQWICVYDQDGPTSFTQTCSDDLSQGTGGAGKMRYTAKHRKIRCYRHEPYRKQQHLASSEETLSPGNQMYRNKNNCSPSRRGCFVTAPEVDLHLFHNENLSNFQGSQKNTKARKPPFKRNDLYIPLGTPLFNSQKFTNVQENVPSHLNIITEVFNNKFEREGNILENLSYPMSALVKDNDGHYNAPNDRSSQTAKSNTNGDMISRLVKAIDSQTKSEVRDDNNAIPQFLNPSKLLFSAKINNLANRFCGPKSGKKIMGHDNFQHPSRNRVDDRFTASHEASYSKRTQAQFMTQSHTTQTDLALLTCSVDAQTSPFCDATFLGTKVIQSNVSVQTSPALQKANKRPPFSRKPQNRMKVLKQPKSTRGRGAVKYRVVKSESRLYRLSRDSAQTEILARRLQDVKNTRTAFAFETPGLVKDQLSHDDWLSGRYMNCDDEPITQDSPSSSPFLLKDVETADLTSSYNVSRLSTSELMKTDESSKPAEVYRSIENVGHDLKNSTDSRGNEEATNQKPKPIMTVVGQVSSTAQNELSACSHRAERSLTFSEEMNQSNFGSSKMSELKNLCLIRPTWQNANIDEVERRVQWALRRRQELHRQRTLFGRTSLATDVSEVSNDVTEKLSMKNYDNVATGHEKEDPVQGQAHVPQAEIKNTRALTDEMDSSMSTSGAPTEVSSEQDQPNPENTVDDVTKKNVAKATRQECLVRNVDQTDDGSKETEKPPSHGKVITVPQYTILTSMEQNTLKRVRAKDKNSPPTKISKVENILTTKQVKTDELVHGLPQVPLASFVEWFIETSDPNSYVCCSDHSSNSSSKDCEDKAALRRNSHISSTEEVSFLVCRNTKLPTGLNTVALRTPTTAFNFTLANLSAEEKSAISADFRNMAATQGGIVTPEVHKGQQNVKNYSDDCIPDVAARQRPPRSMVPLAHQTIRHHAENIFEGMPNPKWNSSSADDCESATVSGISASISGTTVTHVDNAKTPITLRGYTASYSDGRSSSEEVGEEEEEEEEEVEEEETEEVGSTDTCTGDLSTFMDGLVNYAENSKLYPPPLTTLPSIGHPMPVIDTAAAVCVKARESHPAAVVGFGDSKSKRKDLEPWGGGQILMSFRKKDTVDPGENPSSRYDRTRIRLLKSSDLTGIITKVQNDDDC